MNNNNKSIAMFFSLMPGAGHMYLGLQTQGIQLMSLFFLIIFISGSLQIEALMFLLPIIWFYSIFDVRQKFNNPGKIKDTSSTESFLSFETILKTINSKFIGYLFIFIGIIAICDNIVLPAFEIHLDWQIRNYFRTALGSCILIFCGVKMLMGIKSPLTQQEEPLYEKEESNK